jgi:DNA topoisomerase-3
LPTCLSFRPHFDLKPVDKTRTRLNAVVKLAKRKDVDKLVNACDAGREGELIFRLIEQYAGGSKPLGKPVSRLWLQSMTPQAIRDGFAHLRTDAQMQPLADAARCRSEADWLVGINGTRAMTAFNSRDGGFFLTTVGRVQTPTLSRGGGARRADPQIHQPRLLGNSRHLQRPGGRIPGQVVQPGMEKRCGRC